MASNIRNTFFKESCNTQSILNPINGRIVKDIVNRIGQFLWHQQFNELCGVPMVGYEPVFKNGLLEGFKDSDDVFSEIVWIGQGLAPFNPNPHSELSDGLGYFKVDMSVYDLVNGQLVLYNLDWCGVTSGTWCGIPNKFRTRPTKGSTFGVFYNNNSDNYYVVYNAIYKDRSALTYWWGSTLEQLFLEDPYSNRICSWESHLLELMDLDTMEDHTVEEIVERLYHESQSQS